MNKNNFRKHDIILRNKEDIIKQYNDYVPMRLTAREYGVSIGCISNNIKLWGLRRKHGLKHILKGMISNKR